MTPGGIRPTTSWSGTRRSLPRGVVARILRRDKTCQGCGSTQHLEVDHRVPVAEALLLGWTQDQIDHDNNLHVLCHDCHSTKTRGEQLRGLARRRAVRSRRPHPGLIA